MTTLPRIALLGDERGSRSHQELNALIPRLERELDVAASWVPTDSGFDIAEYDGVWLAPGSPYADDDAVVEALTVVRREGIPFIGSCGGMQYAVIEFLRTRLGTSATHAESDGVREDNAVEALTCSLYGEERLVTPVAGSRFAQWVSVPFVGMHFCDYAPSTAAIAELERAGVVVGATAPDAGAEVLEFPDHPFYVVSMFQPQIGASEGKPIHGLVRAFAKAVAGAAGIDTGHGGASPPVHGRETDASDPSIEPTEPEPIETVTARIAGREPIEVTNEEIVSAIREGRR